MHAVMPLIFLAFSWPPTLMYITSLLTWLPIMPLTWQVHLDVKPRNFCVANESPPVAGPGAARQQLPRIYIIDLEGSRCRLLNIPSS